ncbi:ParB family chromosome partitioning protein [Povalibacter uvarum]|uniref:Probable chromosome-partitioning protein ParB n=1 Tax=Povalibacter uvarum TaxID=732238 RepID=A0A841HK75_9GAMM|nr:ParB/RepB/Spo0J family partition protein [Povalibacter uvarum]MBB6093123.1 ParB family chromosome partitioning protein [Povalibacter uvarum]
MSTKRPSLGRGLGALLGQPAPAAASEAPVAQLRPDEELVKLPVDLLQRGKYQPRIDMHMETLQELADSIKAQGLIQPILVRPIGEPVAGQPRRYEIIAGERRWRAAQLAGLHEIPSIVRRVPDEAAVAMALIENIQRENLNPLEEARALERLISEFDMTHATAAEAVGRSRAAVSNLLRLLDLCDEAKALVERGELEMGHARALLGLENKRQQAEVAAMVAKKKLSVRETEALVRRMVTGAANEAPPAPRVDPNIRKLESDLSEKLGAKVQVQHSSSGKGKLVIAYHTLDELDGIIEHIR